MTTPSRILKPGFEPALQAAFTLGQNTNTTTGLTWGYYGGVVQLSTGASTTITDNVVGLTNNATNYVQMNPANGAIAANTSGFTAGYRWMAKVVTSGGVITGVPEDSRDATAIINYAAAASAAAVASVATSIQQASDAAALMAYIGY